MYKILALSLLITGCTPVIADRDFEKEEREYIKQHADKRDPFASDPTPDYVKAGDVDGVTVGVHKGASTITPEKLEMQQWYAVIHNNNDYPVCALVLWQLMDFELITDYPDYIYLKPHQDIFNYAKLRQQIWNMDGTKFALPPSGYIHYMDVKEPLTDKKNPCEFEEDVDDK